MISDLLRNKGGGLSLRGGFVVRNSTDIKNFFGPDLPNRLKTKVLLFCVAEIEIFGDTLAKILS